MICDTYSEYEVNCVFHSFRFLWNIPTERFEDENYCVRNLFSNFVLLTPKLKNMKKLSILFLFVACLIMTACSKDEPVTLENIVGAWDLQYPEGLQTEGYVEWEFNSNGQLFIRSYDVFAGDHTSRFDYLISEEKKSLTISGDITDSEGETVHDTFAIYTIDKLSKKELLIKQSWVNTKYEDLAPEYKNVFLLGGYKEESFRRWASK